MALPPVSLGTDGIRTSPIGFGCASLFRLSRAAQRAHLLHAAYDAGFRHFDVAPMYGLGRAEAELGRFARRHRPELTIATKFGLYATLAGRSLGHAQAPIRRVLEARPAMRDRATAHVAGPASSRLGRLLYSQGAYDAAGARKSLERSLRVLGTGYIDLLLLHDPFPGSVRSDEVSCYLEDARASGLIRSWGVAGDPGPVTEVARTFPGGVPVRQFRDDIFLRSPGSAPAGSGVITFGMLGRALPRLVNHVRAGASRRARWAAMTGSDCGDDTAAASFLLRSAFRDNPAGVVLYSTTRPARLVSAVTAWEMSRAPEDPALDAFRQLAVTELLNSQETEEAAVDHLR